MNDRMRSQTEAEIQRHFRELYDRHLEEQGERIPEPDLSFLCEKEPERRKKSGALRRFTKIAASVTILFVTSSGMAVWMNSDAAYAFKFNIEKTFHKISGAFFSTDDSNDIDLSEDQFTTTVNSMDDIEDVIGFVPNLPVPEYVPEEFELENLNVTKYIDGSYTAEYNFQNSEEVEFMITSNYKDDDDTSIDLVGGVEKVLIGGRKVYIVEDLYTSTCNVTFLDENQFITIVGGLEESDMIKVAENIIIK